MTSGYVEFEFDLPGALLQTLVGIFEKLEPCALSNENAKKIPEEQGVYQLFLAQGDEFNLVYIGKTDAKAGLRHRLMRHAEKVQNRLNLDPTKIYFKAVRVFVFTAVDLETQLINHYGGISKVVWNNSGFGSNDPGEKRDTTTYKDSHFETQFPIDIRQEITFEVPMVASAAVILNTLKNNLPYVIRFQRPAKGKRRAHSDLESTEISLAPEIRLTPENIISQVIERLPVGWHATMLPSHIIIYKDDDRKFPSGQLIAKS